MIQSQTVLIGRGCPLHKNHIANPPGAQSCLSFHRSMQEKDLPPPSYNYQSNNGYAGPPPAQPAQPPQQHTSSSDYPGVVGATPACQRGVQGYDAYGQPIRPPFMEQRYQIEQSMGPVCPAGGFHELRMHYTNTTLLFAILILPYLCGWRGKRLVIKEKKRKKKADIFAIKRKCVCKRCGQEFPNIVLPEPYN